MPASRASLKTNTADETSNQMESRGSDLVIARASDAVPLDPAGSNDTISIQILGLKDVYIEEKND